MRIQFRPLKPALLRSMARRKATKIVEEAQAMAICRSHPSIWIRGYILASAKIKRDRLIEPLRMCCSDPGNYKEEFDA